MNKNELIEYRNKLKEMQQKNFYTIWCFEPGYDGDFPLSILELEKMKKNSKEVADQITDIAGKQIILFCLENEFDFDSVTISFTLSLLSKKDPEGEKIEDKDIIDDKIIVSDLNCCADIMNSYGECYSGYLIDYVHSNQVPFFEQVLCSYSQLESELNQLGFDFKFPDFNTLKAETLAGYCKGINENGCPKCTVHFTKQKEPILAKSLK